MRVRVSFLDVVKRILALRLTLDSNYLLCHFVVTLFASFLIVENAVSAA